MTEWFEVNGYSCSLHKWFHTQRACPECPESRPAERPQLFIIRSSDGKLGSNGEAVERKDAGNTESDSLRPVANPSTPVVPVEPRLTCHICGTTLDPNWLNCPKCEGKARSSGVEPISAEQPSNSRFPNEQDWATDLLHRLSQYRSTTITNWKLDFALTADRLKAFALAYAEAYAHSLTTQLEEFGKYIAASTVSREPISAEQWLKTYVHGTPFAGLWQFTLTEAEIIKMLEAYAHSLTTQSEGK